MKEWLKVKKNILICLFLFACLIVITGCNSSNSNKKSKKDWLEFPEIYFDKAISDLETAGELTKYQRGKKVTIDGNSLSYRELRELRKKDANYYIKIENDNTRDGRNNIIFDTQYWFNDCINPQTNCKLLFDFYLPSYQCLIEYDGEQHFKYTNQGWNNKDHFEQVQYRDEIKNQYCKEKGIKLIRIPYWDYDKIDIEYLLNKINN